MHERAESNKTKCIITKKGLRRGGKKVENFKIMSCGLCRMKSYTLPILGLAYINGSPPGPILPVSGGRLSQLGEGVLAYHWKGPMVLLNTQECTGNP